MSLKIFFAAGAAAALIGCSAKYDTSSNKSAINGVNLSTALENPEIINDYPCTQENGEAGVEICHLPPGNLAALHTICIGAPAIKAHIDEFHGEPAGGVPDVFGKCSDAF
jgi:hypothetical protein